MSINHKYLPFSVIIFVTIIYANSNNFIPSDQEFFPIVYAQSLPLPLPTLSSDNLSLSLPKPNLDQMESLKIKPSQSILSNTKNENKLQSYYN